MAQIDTSGGGGKKKKGAQKKMAIHVDFTPMVDMNMLLITFFMLCTTMIKSQTLNISLPSNEKIESEDQQSKAKNSEAITMILTTERDKDGNIKIDGDGRPKNIIYYYEGKPFIEDANKDGLIDESPDGYGVLRSEKFLGNDNGWNKASVKSFIIRTNKLSKKSTNRKNCGAKRKSLTKNSRPKPAKSVMTLL